MGVPDIEYFMRLTAQGRLKAAKLSGTDMGPTPAHIFISRPKEAYCGGCEERLWGKIEMAYIPECDSHSMMGMCSSCGEEGDDAVPEGFTFNPERYVGYYSTDAPYDLFTDVMANVLSGVLDERTLLLRETQQ